MRTSLALLALVVAACSGPTEPAVATPTSAGEEARTRGATQGDPVQLASFDAVWKTIQETHWDLSHVDWRGIRAELRPRARAARSRAEVREVIQEMLGRLEQSHFGVIPGETYEALQGGHAPTGTAAEESSTAGDGGSDGGDAVALHPDDRGSGTVGIELRILDGQAVVTRIQNDTPAARAGVQPGWVVRDVRGTPLADALEPVAEAYAEGASLREVMLTRAAEARLEGVVETAIPVTFVDNEGAEVTLELERIEPAGRVVRFGNLPPILMRYESKELGSDVGYIAFTAFFDPSETMTSFVRDVSRFRDARVDGLVLDLRGNPGGIGAMAIGIGSWLVTRPNQSLGTMMTKDSELKFVLNPQPEPFTGKVAILVDNLSLSTSEILAGGLKDIGRARVFGTRTGGAALPSTIERLPNGDGFQYAMANYVSAGGDVLEGRGVVPDEHVPLTRKALASGRDPVLDAAVAWIRAPN